MPPKLPPGFKWDEPQKKSVPQLPQGFKWDQPATAQKTPAPPAQPVLPGSDVGMFRHQLNSLGRGVASIPEGVLGVGDAISGLAGYPINTAGAFREDVSEALPLNPELAESFLLTDVPQGFGSMFGFLGGGAALRGANLGSRAAAGVLGGAVGGGHEFTKSQEIGADPVKTALATATGVGLGITEMVPIGNTLERLGGKTFAKALTKHPKLGKKVADWINSHPEIAELPLGALEEGLQEYLQTAGIELSDKFILGLQKDLDQSIEEVGRGTGAGAIVGGVTAFLASLISRKGLKNTIRRDLIQTLEENQQDPEEWDVNAAVDEIVDAVTPPVIGEPEPEPLPIVPDESITGPKEPVPEPKPEPLPIVPDETITEPKEPQPVVDTAPPKPAEPKKPKPQPVVEEPAPVEPKPDKKPEADSETTTKSSHSPDSSTLDSASHILGKKSKAKTKSMDIDTQFAVVDIDDLITSDLEAFPQELQPRDRSREASSSQISEIMRKLDPERLGENILAKEGAPIIGDDLVVESGNGRTLAIRGLYNEQGENIEKYKQFISDNAEQFGINPDELSGINKPVLVRVRRSDVDRTLFTREANERTEAAFSTIEQAKIDAERISDEMLNLFNATEAGDIDGAENASFIRAFMGAVPVSERGDFLQSGGVLSIQGISRIKNAILAKAFGQEDSDALEKMAEDPSSPLKNIYNTLLRVSGNFARVRSKVKSGDLHDLDISGDISVAVRKIADIRESGGSVADFLNQETLFDDGVSDEAKVILAIFEKFKRSPVRLAEILKDYLAMVEDLGNPKQPSFVDLGTPTKIELLRDIVGSISDETGGILEQALPDEDTARSNEEIERAETEEKSEPEPKKPKPKARREKVEDKPAETDREAAAREIIADAEESLSKTDAIMEKKGLGKGYQAFTTKVDHLGNPPKNVGIIYIDRIDPKTIPENIEILVGLADEIHLEASPFAEKDANIVAKVEAAIKAEGWGQQYPSQNPGDTWYSREALRKAGVKRDKLPPKPKGKKKPSKKTGGKKDGKTKPKKTTERSVSTDKSGRKPSDAGATGGRSATTREQEEVRPGIRVAGRDLLPRPQSHVDSKSYNSGLDENQVLGVNLMLDRFQSGGKGFMLADGTGVGKTRQFIAVAAEFRETSDKPILLITQSKQILDTRFKADAKAMGVDLESIAELGTYTDLSKGKKGQKDQYGLVIFDEAHNLKNADSLKTIAANNIDADHKLFGTATPMDRPTGAAYFMSEVTGKPIDEILDQIGVYVSEGFDRFGKKTRTVNLQPGFNWATVKQNLVKIRDQAIREGAMIRREYPFFGEISTETVELSQEELFQQRAIDRYWEAIILSARNPRMKRNMAGQRILELGRWLESRKINAIKEKTKKLLSEGRKVVIVAEGINTTHIKGLKKDVPGLIGELSKALKADGIGFSKIYGPGDKSAEVSKFQNGDVDVALATPQSGGAGIDLDDSVGGAPRTMLIATPNFSGDVFDQIQGRVSRRNTKTPAELIYMKAPQGISDERRSEILEKKLLALKSIQGGEDIDEVREIDSEGIDTGEGRDRFRPALQKRRLTRFKRQTSKKESLEHRVSAPKSHRIQADPIPTKDEDAGEVKNFYIDLEKTFGKMVRQGYSPRGALGVFFPQTTRIEIRRHGNLDVPLHEIAHYLDDKHYIMPDEFLTKNDKGNWVFSKETKRNRTILKQLEFYWSTSGTAKKHSKAAVKVQEAFAEWVRAWALNPNAVEQATPELNSIILKAIPAKDLKKLELIGNRIRKFAGQSALSRTMERIKSPTAFSRISSWINILNRGKTAYQTDAMTITEFELFSSTAPLMKMVRELKALRGIVDQKASDDVEMLVRNLSGISDKFSDALKNGMMNTEFKREGIFEKVAGGLEHMLEPASRGDADEETINRRLNLAIATMVSQRVSDEARKRTLKLFMPLIETRQQKIDAIAAKWLDENGDFSHKVPPYIQREFDRLNGEMETILEVLSRDDLKLTKKVELVVNRLEEITDEEINDLTSKAPKVEDKIENLSGVGRGVYADEQEARKALEELQSMPKEEKDIIADLADRYRAQGIALLQYQHESGLLSYKKMIEIINDNQYWVDMHRVFDEYPEDVEPPGMGGSGRNLKNRRQLIHKFMGSTREIANPYLNLLDAMYNTINEGDKNRAKLALRRLLFVPRNMWEGQQIDTDKFASRSSSGRGARMISMVVNGKVEYWQFHDKHVYLSFSDSFKGDGEDGWFFRAMQMPVRLLKAGIVHSPDFMARNLIRDAVARGVLSRSGTKPWEFTGITDDDWSLWRQGGGGQGRHYLNNKVDYNRKLHETIKEMSSDPKTVLVLDPIKMFRKWHDLAGKSESIGRVVEFKNAYKKAIEEGAEHKDAIIKASFESRDLLDFMQAGRSIRTLNKYIPFLNPAFQGVYRTYKGAKEDPAQFFSNWTKYVFAPTLLTLAWNYGQGDDEREEYQQMPAYIRDMFWNFKIGKDRWLRIPKPFEMGAMAAGAERFIEFSLGNDKAFEGTEKSIVTSLLPVKLTDVAGPYKTELEALMNYNLFRGKAIIPPWEKVLDVERREGADRASRIGKMIAWGVEQIPGAGATDPRFVDHFFLGHLGGSGRLLLNISDTGKPGNFDKTTTSALGVLLNSPGFNARDVTFVLNKAKQQGLSNSKKLRRMRNIMDDLAGAENKSDKDKFKRLLRREASRVRNLHFGAQ